jgi:osmoprotectant transport system ATP-binding protein
VQCPYSVYSNLRLLSNKTAMASNIPPQTNAEQNAVIFENVTKRFPAATHPAVDSISLEVPRGSLVVLLGPSGCGKTTLLKMVNRLYEYDSGRIFVESKEIRGFDVTSLRRRIGYVIQSTGLFPHMTVAKNIATVPDMLGWDRSKIEKRTEMLLEMVGLSASEYLSRYPAQLSGGQQQRVGLARALAADPHIMLMDEPFAAIDNITRRRLQDELLDIQGKMSKTILFVTHDVEEAIRLADKIAVIRHGKVIQYDTPLNILSHPANEFVADLTGAKDVLRRLSLLTVDAVLSKTEAQTYPTNGPILPPGSSLREALGVLLSSQVNQVTISDSEGKVRGVVNMDTIKRATLS